LAACGSSPSSNSGSATKGNITWWESNVTPEIAHSWFTAFNKQYPHIHVTLKYFATPTAYDEGLSPGLASNVGPDVFDVTANGTVGIQTYGQDAIDLTPAMEKLRGSSWKKGLYSPGITDFTQHGRLVGAAVGRVATGFLWINQALFNKYDVTPPTTLAQWVSDCKIFRSHNLGCLTEGVGPPGFDVDTIHAIANSVKPGAWLKAANGKMSWNSAPIVKALSIFQQMAQDGVLDPGADGIQQYPDATNNFLSGKDAMVMMGTWYQQYTTTAALKAGIEAAGVPVPSKLPTFVPVLFPNVGGHKSYLVGDPDFALAVNAKSKQTAAATTFALWVSSTEKGQQAVATSLTETPVLLSVTPDWKSLSLVDPSVQLPKLEQLSPLLNAVTEPRQANLSAAMIAAIEVADESVVGGQATPQQAAAKLEQTQQANPVSG
jgi:ABC-type glycerol-3-phosphate transport system substrate-binding protein